MCLCAGYAHTSAVPAGAKRGHWIPWSCSYGQLWAARWRFWELNSSPLEEQYTLLTAESSLQPLYSIHSMWSYFFRIKSHEYTLHGLLHQLTWPSVGLMFPCMNVYSLTLKADVILSISICAYVFEYAHVDVRELYMHACVCTHNKCVCAHNKCVCSVVGRTDRNWLLLLWLLAEDLSLSWT